jgi:hypothetical protein
LSGSASLDDFVYEPEAQPIIIGGDGSLSASYRCMPRGRIVIIGGSSTAKEGHNLVGSLMCCGEAAVNILWYDYVGSGEVVVTGTNQITHATLKWANSGKQIVINGTAESLPGQYSHNADGEIKIGGMSDLEFAYFLEDCPNDVFRCKIIHSHFNLSCPETMYFYNDTRVYEDPFYDPTGKGILAPITICRQRFIIPPQDRHPKVPKQRD